MRNIKVFFVFLVCTACVLSCASITRKSMLYVNITNNSKFILLPTSAIEQSIDMAQFLSAEFRGQTYFLNAWVKADEDAIEMLLFNELGASMGELSYRNGTALFSSPVFPRSVTRAIKPEYAIADFQLCFYDPILLAQSLEDIGLTLEIANGSRRILNGNEVIIEITRTANSVKLVNHLRKYTYTLEGDFQ